MYTYDLYVDPKNIPFLPQTSLIIPPAVTIAQIHPVPDKTGFMQFPPAFDLRVIPG